MCGIFGYIGEEKISINKNILPHRGPDDWGVFSDKVNETHICLFQSRLSIIGLGNQGHQPYEKQKGKVLVYNGEIYNYNELKSLLEDKYKATFSSSTDTEVLYELLINEGIDNTLKLINGMFAFSFYDNSKKEIIIARDHVGVKPLYYSFNNNSFLFSSESKVFFELNLIEPELNADFLGEYFANGWVYEPNTLFKDIHKIEAGHYISYNLGNKNKKDIKYFDISKSTKNSQISIDKIVNTQTIADVPIGCYFSGGTDSSIISYLLKDRDIINLNLAMKGAEDERVKVMQKTYNLKIDYLNYDRKNLSLYKKLVYHMDEPIADPAIIPAYLLAEHSKKLGRTVMMSGMGGDEIDAGYNRHKILANLKLFSFIKFIPKKIFESFLHGKKKNYLLRLKNFINSPKPNNYFSLTSYFSKTDIDNLVNKKWFDKYSKKINDLCKEVEGKKKFFLLDFKGFLSSHNLLYMDKASMASSIEVRVPLLDYQLVQDYFQNIDKKKYSGKKRLTNYLKQLLKENYSTIKKEGFSYNIEEWIEKDINWNAIISFFEETTIIKTDPIKKWVKEMEKDVFAVAMKLWTIYTLYLWLTTFKIKI